MSTVTQNPTDAQKVLQAMDVASAGGRHGRAVATVSCERFMRLFHEPRVVSALGYTFSPKGLALKIRSHKM